MKTIDRPHREISDEEIVEAWQSADEIIFSARPFNSLERESVCFGAIIRLIPLMRIMPLIGITPEELRLIFEAYPQAIYVNRRFPANLSWLGLNRRTKKIVYRKLPSLRIEIYEQLGSFPLMINDNMSNNTSSILNYSPFQLLAKIFGKSIKVIKVNTSCVSEHRHLFTVQPSGQVTQID